MIGRGSIVASSSPGVCAGVEITEYDEPTEAVGPCGDEEREWRRFWDGA